MQSLFMHGKERAQQGVITGFFTLIMLVLPVGALAQSVTPGLGRSPGPAILAVPPQQAPASAATGPQQAQPDASKIVHVEVTRRGRANSDIFMGVYLALDRECRVGGPPRIEFTSPPANGRMKTRNHPINLREVPGAPRRTCIGTSPNGVAVVYRADPRFRGEDQVVFRAFYPNGDIREVTARVTIN